MPAVEVLESDKEREESESDSNRDGRDVSTIDLTEDECGETAKQIQPNMVRFQLHSLAQT